MKTSDGALVRIGQVYLARASKGEVSKSGWIKVTIVSIDEGNDTAIASAKTKGFGSPVLSSKDLKTWKKDHETITHGPTVYPTYRGQKAKPIEVLPPYPDKATGFDYVKGEFVFHSNKEWKKQASEIVAKNGIVRTMWGLGETFFYLPIKNSSKYEMVAEVYDVGFEKGK